MYARSMAFHATPTELHPIDVAAYDFGVTALCGPGHTTARSGLAGLMVDR